jgi:flagellar biosynthesis/type III secretory pathway protein FliH
MDHELKQHLEAMESRLAAQTGHLEARFDARMEQLETRLVEKMRDMQTQLLRGFASFSEAQTLRLRKVEADQSNLNASISGRMAVLERRLLEIEMRLGGAGRN